MWFDKGMVTWGSDPDRMRAKSSTQEVLVEDWGNLEWVARGEGDSEYQLQL